MASEKKTTQESNPWAPSQGGLESVLRRADKYGKRTDLFRPEVGGQTEQSLTGLEGLANQGSAAVQPLEGVLNNVSTGANAGFGNLSSTASGDYLNGNPFFQQALNSQLDNVANRTNQQFSGAGRYGSAAHTDTLSRNMGELSTNAFMQNYSNERQNQMSASGTLANAGMQAGSIGSQLDQANAYGSNLMGQVGAQRDAIAMAQKQAPLRATEWQAGLTGPIAAMGGTQTSSTPVDRTGQIIGGVTMAAGLASGNPMMIAQGAGGVAGGGQSAPAPNMASGNGTLWPSFFGNSPSTAAMPGRIY